MEAKKAEFFIIIGEEPDKVKGVVFNHKGRLLGINSDEKPIPFWLLVDIKTGLVVNLCFYNPLDSENEKSVDELLDDFDNTDRINAYKDLRARNAEKIKAAYEANPDVKRQVFGE